MSTNPPLGSFLQTPPPNTILFHGSNSQTVLLITSDGRLEKGLGYSTEEAAQVLFDAVSDHIAGVWKQTRDENAALRERCEIEEGRSLYWRQNANKLEAKNAAQGLSLACLADGILGEDAADRSDQMLVRVGCQLARDVAALRTDKEHLVTLLKTWYDMAQSCHLEQQEVGHSEYQITVGMLVDTQAAIDAAMKEES